MSIAKLNQFAKVRSSLNIPRSRFDRPFDHKSTCNAGSLIPVYVEEMLPGDTVTIGTRKLIRMSTPLYPVMDNSYADLYWFFVPNRLVWDHWEEFITGSSADPTDWEEDVEYLIPQMNFQMSSVVDPCKVGSVADYMGIITKGTSAGTSGSISFSVSALPFRGYALIWNEWFRDENQYPKVDIMKSDASVTYNDLITFDWNADPSAIPANGVAGGTPLPVAKFHDYFTSALPLPQKNVEGVSIALNGVVPLGTKDESYTVQNLDADGIGSIKFGATTGTGSTGSAFSSLALANSTIQDSVLWALNDGKSSAVQGPVDKTNLYANLEEATGANISTLRMAFQMQRLFERDARGGTRYFEYLQSGFGVTSPDARLQRPEYVYGSRTRINVTQVLQTNDPASGSDASPLGRTGAFSLTGDRDDSFTYSSVEHGYLFGLMCIRTDQTYGQGINKMWWRRRRFDFYDPVFAHISEQPIYNREIYMGLGHDEVFGYQEAWSEYRYSPNRVSGYMRPGVDGSLDVWHYANYFESTPTLSPAFLGETKDNIDRTLAVSSDLAHQFIFDFHFDTTWVRPMPMYSVPGLIDHF